MADACPLCGEPVEDDAARCGNCGAEIPRGKRAQVQALGEALRDLAVTGKGEAAREECPACGEPRPEGAPTCPACGHAYVPGAAEPPPLPLTPEEEQWLAELEYAIAGEEKAPPPPLEAEVPEGVVEAKRGLFDFLRAIPGVSREAAKNVAVVYLNADHIAMAEAEDLAAVPEVTPDEAARIKEAADRFVARKAVAPPEPEPAPPPPPPTREAARPRAPPSAPKAPLPPIPAVTRRPASRVAPIRDVAAIATVIGLPAGIAAAAAVVPGYEFGLLFLFGVLFGIAAAMTLPDLVRAGRPSPLRLAGAFGFGLLVAVPISGYGGAPLEPAAGVPILALGAALLAASGWRLRDGPWLFVPWIAGLLLLTVLSAGPLAFLSPGPPEVASAAWAAGGALALAFGAFVAVRRILRYALDGNLRRADEAFADRDFPEAEARYDAAIRASRRAGAEDAAAWYGKGSVLVARGRFDEALRCLDRALELNPANEVAWVNRGTALSRLGRMNEALRCYNAAIKANPRYEVAWNNKGNALARIGKHDWALQCYERALDLDPAYRTAWVNKGFVLTKLGRFEEAAECADTALRLTTAAPS